MFKTLLSFDEAKKRVSKAFTPKPVGIEKVPLMKAVGRVLAQQVISPIDVPPFHRSTVDGFAVKAVDTFGADEKRPRVLKLVGHADVGEMPTLSVTKGTTVEIVTGAPLPQGAEAIVMVEDTAEKDEKIFVYKPVAKGENVMKMGSDIYKDETVFDIGRTLSSRELGVLAALGFTQVNVFKIPAVAVISTGAEIVEPGEPLPPGKVYDINTYSLAAAVLESGGQPVCLGVVRDDDEKSLKETLKKAIEKVDVVITSGGVSVGPKDIVPKVLRELGKPGLIVYGIAVKPGKPVAVAIIDHKPVFSLPGHPTSSLLMFHLLIRPIILAMSGKEEKLLTTVTAVSREKLFVARGRRTFIMVTLSSDKRGRWVAAPVSTGESGAITTLAKADGYVELKETQQFIEAGEELTVFRFNPLKN